MRGLVTRSFENCCPSQLRVRELQAAHDPYEGLQGESSAHKLPPGDIANLSSLTLPEEAGEPRAVRCHAA